MSLPDALSLITLLSAFIVMAYTIKDFKDAPVYRKFIRGSMSLVMMAFMFLYTYALWGPDSYWVRIGLPNRVGLWCMFFILCVDIWTLRQSQKLSIHEKDVHDD
jgi:hypothetical protein